MSSRNIQQKGKKTNKCKSSHKTKLTFEDLILLQQKHLMDCLNVVTARATINERRESNIHLHVNNPLISALEHGNFKHHRRLTSESISKISRLLRVRQSISKDLYENRRSTSNLNDCDNTENNNDGVGSSDHMSNVDKLTESQSVVHRSESNPFRHLQVFRLHGSRGQHASDRRCSAVHLTTFSKRKLNLHKFKHNHGYRNFYKKINCSTNYETDDNHDNKKIMNMKVVSSSQIPNKAGIMDIDENSHNDNSTVDNSIYPSYSETKPLLDNSRLTYSDELGLNDLVKEKSFLTRDPGFSSSPTWPSFRFPSNSFQSKSNFNFADKSSNNYGKSLNPFDIDSWSNEHNLVNTADIPKSSFSAAVYPDSVIFCTSFNTKANVSSQSSFVQSNPMCSSLEDENLTEFASAQSHISITSTSHPNSSSNNTTNNFNNRIITYSQNCPKLSFPTDKGLYESHINYAKLSPRLSYSFPHELYRNVSPDLIKQCDNPLKNSLSKLVKSNTENLTDIHSSNASVNSDRPVSLSSFKQQKE